MKKVLFICLTCILISACTEKVNGPSHVAFKEVKSDKWGLMTLGGKVTIEDEYSAEPTPVVNEIFYVANSESDYYMYNINNPTSPVGNKYVDVSMFKDELAPTVKKGEWIKYIDKEGETKIELSKNIRKAYSFKYGYSLIENMEGLWGAINLKGSTIIPIKYSELSPISEEEVYACRDNKCYIYNISNKKETEIKGFPLNEDYVIYEEDGKKGLMDRKGNIIIRAKYAHLYLKDEKEILFAALNEDGWGIINANGETIIKHKYNSILDCKNNMFIALRDWDEGYGLLNMNEDRLVKYEYESMKFLPGTEYVVATKKKDFTSYVIDTEGKIIGEYSELGIFAPEEIDEMVVSDYFDMDGCITFLLFGKNRNINELFSYAGKKSNECANSLELSLNVGDISNNTWFPEKEYTSSYGDIYIQLGFNKVMESYYDDWMEKNYRFYSDSHCNKANLKFKPNKEINGKQFEDAIISQLKKQGYTEKEDGVDTIFTNGKVNVKVYVDRYSTAYINVSLK